MLNKNIVLLGGSAFVMVNGIQVGLRKKGFKVSNLALGGTSALQNLYELKRNYEILKNSDLIITSSNVHDIGMYNNINSLKYSFEIIDWFYKELFHLNKKIIVFITPTPQTWMNEVCIKSINNFHKKLANKYGFNVIDLQEFYIKTNLLYTFQALRDGAHDFDFVMRTLGENIANNFHKFLKPKKINFSYDNPTFKIIKAKYFSKKLSKECFTKENSSFKEECLFIDHNDELEIDQKYNDYKIIGIHFWDSKGKFKFINKKEIEWGINFSHLGFTNFTHFDDLSIKPNMKFKPLLNSSMNFISFFLVKNDYIPYSQTTNFEILAYEKITIKKEYDFNHLIPPIKFYKEIIDEYCAIMDSRKLAPLQKQISDLSQQNLKINQKTNLELANLEQDLIFKKLQNKKLAKQMGIKINAIMPKLTMINPNSAKARIHNHLSYKLGQALIENSKSIFGFIRMPYVLSYIKDKHKFEQKIYEEKIKQDPNLALPSLETYPDYNEALKEKECFTYKLGEALIQANKNWYGGGYIKFIFKDVPRLKREFKKNKL
ncbi:SGNH/GDSL hydrolase family protein [Campylobacter novaezeelandiae]|uniref:SGNH/GDSL hydrolase family protein n=1 Tax=Campylobacter novaezeelandiae TaxID=2267891 RepID=A0A4Q9JUE4_9BACT|nr:SGNH/GDSL hydrolase family protein [Campylobacter novaezeelandiae]TBR81281.1 SGNH/GDSL hydrolase family protein [Campylobacter novaezeelandiae]